MPDMKSDANAKKYVTLASERILFQRDRYKNSPEILAVHTTYTEERARMAAVLIEKWGMVAADVDGEDSSGRAKGRVMTPSEVVNRACTTADLARAEFERRGWVHEIPAAFTGVDFDDES